jgi:hypothetical protein
MEMRQPIAIGEQGGRSFAEVKDCDVRIEKAMFGYRLDFSFKISPFSGAPDMEPVILSDWNVDLYYREAKGSSVLIGRMVPSLYDLQIELKGRPSVGRQIDLSSDDFLRLADTTSRGDVTFSFKTKPKLLRARYPEEMSEGLLVIAHSEWLQRLNQTDVDRFELVTIRIPVKSSHMHQPFADALQKIRHAEAQYLKGDWIGAAASCRAAWNTVRSATPSGEKAMDHLLAPVTGDPRRKKFAQAIIKSLGDALNSGVHLEGDVKNNVLPAELTAEDALLCIHWYSVVLGYLSSVTPHK